MRWIIRGWPGPSADGMGPRLAPNKEDIGKERTKLDESQAELCKLELQASHIQHLIDHGSEDEMDSNADGDLDEEDDLDLDVGNLSLGPGGRKNPVNIRMRRDRCWGFYVY